MARPSIPWTLASTKPFSASYVQETWLQSCAFTPFQNTNTRPEELSPFVHPSCWDEKPLTSYPPSKEEIEELTVKSNIFDSLPSKKQRAINAKITCALAGVKTKRQLQRDGDQTRLRLLHWWFRANEESLGARLELDPEGLFPRQGNLNTLERHNFAANLTAWLKRTPALRTGQEFYINGITAEDDSLLELADAPPISQVEPLSAGNAPITQADISFRTPTKPLTRILRRRDSSTTTSTARSGARSLRTSSSHRLARSQACRCCGA